MATRAFPSRHSVRSMGKANKDGGTSDIALLDRSTTLQQERCEVAGGVLCNALQRRWQGCVSD